VPDYASGLEGDIAGVRIGLPANYFFEGVEEQIAAGVRVAARLLEDLGARVSEIRLPDPKDMLDLSMLITRAEASTLHARIFRERPQDLQPVVRARLEVGFGISAYDYLQAQRLRATLTRAFVRDVFGEVDVLMTPVIPEPQPALAALKATAVDEFNARAGRFSGLTRPFNGLGLPAISVPCGFGNTGLPLAFQLVGRPFAEALLLRLGHAYQENTGWPARQPELG
jgi:aspartyl-tRNA(Asn)/glutamyl-tRNA(Gln) amidotransferase subunit A